jgi:outer membrane protein assembly factor BamB
MKAISIIPALVLATALGAMGFWMMAPPPDVGGMGVPIPKPKPSMKDEEKSLLGALNPGSAKSSSLSGSWAQFRGNKLDSKSSDPRSILTEWPDNGPSVVWKTKLSKGHGGASIHQGKAYILDYNTETFADVIRCLNVETGQEIWNYAYPVKTKNNHGITRSVPAVNDRFVVTLGPKAQVYCLDAQTGAFIWSKSLVLEYGTVIPKWYSGQCPLMVGEKVLIAPCGPKGFVIQVDCATGQVDWTAENSMRWDMTHTSITPMTLAGGIETYVYSGSGGVAGVDVKTGEVLWVNRQWKIKIAACASPVVIDQERLFLSAGYSAGCMMIRIFKDDEGNWDSKVIFKLEEKAFGSVQHTPILHEGFLYGTRPNGELVCLSLEGQVKWASGIQKYGIGPYMMIGSRMFLLDSKTCDLALVDIQPSAFSPIERKNLWDGHDAYGLMAYNHGLLLLRDLNTMVALDISVGGYKVIN